MLLGHLELHMQLLPLKSGLHILEPPFHWHITIKAATTIYGIPSPLSAQQNLYNTLFQIEHSNDGIFNIQSRLFLEPDQLRHSITHTVFSQQRT